MSAASPAPQRKAKGSKAKTTTTTPPLQPFISREVEFIIKGDGSSTQLFVIPNTGPHPTKEHLPGLRKLSAKVDSPMGQLLVKPMIQAVGTAHQQLTQAGATGLPAVSDIVAGLLNKGFVKVTLGDGLLYSTTLNDDGTISLPTEVTQREFLNDERIAATGVGVKHLVLVASNYPGGDKYPPGINIKIKHLVYVAPKPVKPLDFSALPITKAPEWMYNPQPVAMDLEPEAVESSMVED